LYIFGFLQILKATSTFHSLLQEDAQIPKTAQSLWQHFELVMKKTLSHLELSEIQPDDGTNILCIFLLCIFLCFFTILLKWKLIGLFISYCCDCTASWLPITNDIAVSTIL